MVENTANNLKVEIFPKINIINIIWNKEMMFSYFTPKLQLLGDLGFLGS